MESYMYVAVAQKYIEKPTSPPLNTIDGPRQKKTVPALTDHVCVAKSYFPCVRVLTTVSRRKLLSVSRKDVKVFLLKIKFILYGWRRNVCDSNEAMT